MSAYPPPVGAGTIFNENNFMDLDSMIDLAETDARYLRLTGGIISGELAVNGGIDVNEGSQAAPGLAFEGENSTGIWSPSADTINVSSLGNTVISIGNASMATAIPIRTSSGSAALPGFTFATDVNSGIYSSGPDEVSIATNGQQRAFIDLFGDMNLQNNLVGLGEATFYGQAYRLNEISSSQNIPNGGIQTIRHNITVETTGESQIVYNAGTGVYTVTADGFYEINSSTGLFFGSAVTAGTNFITWISHAGVRYGQCRTVATGYGNGDVADAISSATLSLISGDTFFIQGFQNTGVSRSTFVGSAGTRYNITIAKVA